MLAAERESCCVQRGVRAGEAPLGGSILTGLAGDIGISASVLQERLCVPGLSGPVPVCPAGNPGACLVQLAGDSPTAAIPRNCYPGVILECCPVAEPTS